MIENKTKAIVTLAKLWGIAVADARPNPVVSKDLAAYDEDELAELMESWANGFLASECDDICEFFVCKMHALLHAAEGKEKHLFDVVSAKYSVLYGRFAGITKELYSIHDVADFICEYGPTGDVKIIREDGVVLLDTCGIYISSINDMEYREQLLKVLIPMQMAIDGTEF